MSNTGEIWESIPCIGCSKTRGLAMPRRCKHERSSRCHPSQWLVYVPAKFNYNVIMFEYYPYFKRVWCTVTRGLLTTLRIGPLYPTQTLCPCPSLPGWTVEQLSSARVRTSDQLPSYLGRGYTLVDTVRFQYLTQKIFKP